eukprot:CAMPEP_0180642870 /NCGR_PEP_ID=MMETSP1037_2-20121125/47459_1 /TAXON_ID=632150 /ORGANISM="Azadinium spinosum, Strain 3D9" /LENGTH=57 /DNA_ID=CAMNT_0022666235 /DNA_START=111 /DNA_END=281 /DNA_ORIENTATION=+
MGCPQRGLRYKPRAATLMRPSGDAGQSRRRGEGRSHATTMSSPSAQCSPRQREGQGP